MYVGVCPLSHLKESCDSDTITIDVDHCMGVVTVQASYIIDELAICSTECCSWLSTETLLRKWQKLRLPC